MKLKHHKRWIDLKHGSDEKGDGTKKKPFGTLQKAIDSCPRFTNGVTLYVDGSFVIGGKENNHESIYNK